MSSLQAAITVVRAVLPLLVLGVAKLLVDAATELATGGMVVLPLVGEPADPVHGLYLLGALLLSIWLLDKATWSAEEVVRTYSTNRVESHVHALIMRKCSTLDAAFYESPEYLDMLERAVRGALMNALSFMWGFYFLLSAATSLVATIAVLSTIHWAIPVAIVLSALPQLIATSHFSRQGWALENSLATHFRLLKYLTALMSERQAANEVRLFGLSDYFVPRFRDVNNHRLRREQAFTRRSTLWRAGLGVVSDVAVAGVWVFISVRYALTARENVGFGDVAHVADLRRVSDAAVAAGVEQVWRLLPMDTRRFSADSSGSAETCRAGNGRRSDLRAASCAVEPTRSWPRLPDSTRACLKPRPAAIASKQSRRCGAIRRVG